MAASMVACGILGSMAVGGTLAYLTDTETAVNTFTVGDVKVDMSEPSYPGNESEDVKDLVPNEEVAKDPQVTNTGVNDAIVFMKVEVPVRDVTLVNSDGTKGTKEPTELFWFKDADDTQGTFSNNWSDKWTDLSASKGKEGTSDGSTTTYVFAYSTPITKDEVTEPLFDKIQLKNIVENEVTPGEAQNVVITTYAIQSAEILNGDTDLTDLVEGKLAQANLEAIYDIYVNQSR